MRLKAPAFWQNNNLISNLLIPASCLYKIGYDFKKRMAKPYKSSIPVVCVGGVVTGGSGKTPVLQAILKLIVTHKLYERPIILTRGYGGKLKGPIVVDTAIHTAQDVGDEAILHAHYANVIVSKNRADGAMMAEMMGADIILMDDGLQNHSLFKHVSFLVMDGAAGLGNGRLLPAGPLREPYDDARQKCAAIIETGANTLSDAIKTTLSITSNHNKDLSYFGFSGLGNPKKFKQTLLQNGFKLAGFKAFPDHYAYKDADIQNLLHLAGKHRLITTEKDAVKISDDFKSQIDVLSIELTFQSPQDIVDILRP